MDGAAVRPRRRRRPRRPAGRPLTSTPPSDLDDVRARIDALDRDLVALIAARERLVLEAGRLKRTADAVRAPSRVEQVVRRVRAVAEQTGASPDVVERTYQAMVAAFVERELAATGLAAPPDDVVVAPVAAGDAGEVLVLQRAAYATEARLYGDPELPPLTQTLEELQAELAASVALKAVAASRIVGAVRARVEGSVLHVGRLVVAPDHQGRGVGSRLLAAVEAAAGPAAETAALFTGHLSTGNLALYARRGYVEQRREQVRPGLVLVHLAKRLRPAP